MTKTGAGMSFEHDYLKGFEPPTAHNSEVDAETPNEVDWFYDLASDGIARSHRKNLKFEDVARPATASNYKRLRRSQRISTIEKILKRRGVNARIFELLLRTIAGIPGNWKESNETFRQAVARRARLAGRLRRLAMELRNDREANLIHFSPGLAAYAGIPNEPGLTLTFADLMDVEASLLEGSDGPRVQLEGGEIVTAREFDRLSRPARSVLLRSYALKSIFALLEPYFKRAPNKETETIAAVLLQERISAGSMTRIRRTERRTYSPRNQ